VNPTVGRVPWSLGTQHQVADESLVVLERSRTVLYSCPSGHETRLRFALDALAPADWDCPRCRDSAVLLDAGGGPVLAEERREPRHVRSHLDIVRERRTDDELEALLQERLELLRARRSSR